jgi:hypothetical protein
MCATLLLLDLLLTSPRPHSKLSAPLSSHSASSRTMDLSTTSSTYKAQHSLDQLTQSIRNANNLKAILQLSPQSETIIRTGPSLNWVRLPATSLVKERYNSSFQQQLRVRYRVSHLAIVPALTNITSEQVFLFSYPLTTCSIYWSALRGLEKLHMDTKFVFRDRGLSNLYQHDQKLSDQLLPLLLHNARAHLSWASANTKRNVTTNDNANCHFRHLPVLATNTPCTINTAHTQRRNDDAQRRLRPRSVFSTNTKRKVPHRQCTAAHRRTLPPSAKSPTVPVFIPLLW